LLQRLGNTSTKTKPTGRGWRERRDKKQQNKRQTLKEKKKD